MQLFDPKHPEGPTGTLGSQEGWKSKVKIGVFLFCFIHFWFKAPRGSTGPSKPSKRGPITFSQNKSSEFGVMHKTRLEGDHQRLTLGLMQLCDKTQSQGPTGLLNKSWEFGVMHKTTRTTLPSTMKRSSRCSKNPNWRSAGSWAARASALA